MRLDPLASWIGWWTLRGRQLSTLGAARPEHLHLGNFLREAEILWRKSAGALRAACVRDLDTLELRGKALAQELQTWWAKESAGLVVGCQKLVHEFAVALAPPETDKAHALHKLFSVAVASRRWGSHSCWEYAASWSRDVAATLHAFGLAPLDLAPTGALPFDPASLPQFARSNKFVLGALAAGLGVGGKMTLPETALQAELSKAAETFDAEEGPLVVASAFTLAVVAGRIASKLPRAFHEFCMDLAASPVPALRALEYLFASPSCEGVGRSADWAMFAAWDWTALSGCPQKAAWAYQTTNEVEGWLKNAGLLTSKDAFRLASLVSMAMNALCLHVTTGGIAAVGIAGKQPEASPAPANEVLAKIGVPTGNGRQVDVPLEIGGVTRSVKTRVAAVVDQLGTCGKVTAVDNRTLADLLAACPELEGLLKRAKSGVRGKTNVEAPALVGRVSKR